MKIRRTGAAFPENVHGGVAEQDLGCVHGAREDGHDDCAQLEQVPELLEVLALLLADLVDDVDEEVQDEPNEDQLVNTRKRTRRRHKLLNAPVLKNVCIYLFIYLLNKFIYLFIYSFHLLLTYFISFISL